MASEQPDPARILSPAEIAEIAEREQRASKGPWRSEAVYDGGGTVAIMRDWRNTPGPAAAVQGPDGWIHDSPKTAPDANAEFIAHARQDVPALLDALAALRQQVETLRQERDEWKQAAGKTRVAELEQAIVDMEANHVRAQTRMTQQLAALSAAQERMTEALRSAFTNEVIRAIGALARQKNVCREQGGGVAFVTGMEAAREYIVEQIAAALSPSVVSSQKETTTEIMRDGADVPASTDPATASTNREK